MKKAIIAMSGGVDSSASAVLLLEQGYEVAGVTMALYDQGDIGKVTRCLLYTSPSPRD